MGVRSNGNTVLPCFFDGGFEFLKRVGCSSGNRAVRTVSTRRGDFNDIHIVPDERADRFSHFADAVGYQVRIRCHFMLGCNPMAPGAVPAGHREHRPTHKHPGTLDPASCNGVSQGDVAVERR